MRAKIADAGQATISICRAISILLAIKMPKIKQTASHTSG
jgi:hypothetical protein